MAIGSATVQVIYGLALVMGAFLAAVVWRHRERTGAKALFVAILGGSWWTAMLFAATLVADPDLSILLSKAIYPGVGVAVAAIFLFGLAYTGREHLVNRRVIGLLAVEPVVVVVLAFLNPGDVFFASIGPAAESATGVAFTFGPAFQIHALYSYALTLATGALVLGMLYRTRAIYRGQFVVLLAAVVVPLVANVVAVAGWVSFDSTPVGFVLADAFYTIAIVRYRLIDLVPIARDRVVNNVTDAMYAVDTDHRVVDVNPEGEDLAREYVGDVDLIGEDARDLLEAVPELRTMYTEVVDEGEDRRIEYALDGRHFLSEATPIQDSRDHTVGWLFLIRDITERKEREQQLRERNEQLDKFASVVSHDLRNPLQVAAGRVELARETGDTSHLEDVETALDRMESIIEDVLSLARGGDEVTDPSPVSLAGVARDAWDNVETTDATISIETDARIVADRDRLSRLLENLFRNAVEHAPTATDDTEITDAGSATEGLLVREGGADLEQVANGEPEPTLSVRLGDFDGEDGPGFYVADDGPGIPPEDREVIFESGYSTNEDGTGFGLTIVSQIAEAHGWDVRATESEDGGARFELTGVERAD
jgi:PAS domain S-box-containing protein